MKIVKKISEIPSLFPYVPTLVLPHILENGNIETVYPKWLEYIMQGNGSYINRYVKNKYSSLRVCLDDELYIDDYVAFLYGVNESMYRYYDLFTTQINPYHNVDEHTVITDIFGEVENEKLFGKRKSTSSIGERVNEMSYAQDSVTTTDGKYGQDSSVLKATNNSNTTTSAKTDTQTNNKNGSTDIIENDAYTDKDTTMTYTNTHETERGGNIGVTTNSTLAFEHINYAHAMKLYDLFIDEWLDYFSTGLWGD